MTEKICCECLFTSFSAQKAGAATDSMLRERLSEDALQEAGLIKNAQDARGKLQRVRTGKV